MPAGFRNRTRGRLGRRLRSAWLPYQEIIPVPKTTRPTGDPRLSRTSESNQMVPRQFQGRLGQAFKNVKPHVVRTAKSLTQGLCMEIAFTT